MGAISVEKKASNDGERPSRRVFHSSGGSGISKRLKWSAAVYLLLTTSSLAFSPQARTTTVARPPETATSRVASIDRWPTQLLVSAAPQSAEVGTDDLDLEALRGPDGIYNIETKEQHK